MTTTVINDSLVLDPETTLLGHTFFNMRWIDTRERHIMVLSASISSHFLRRVGATHPPSSPIYLDAIELTKEGYLEFDPCNDHSRYLLTRMGSPFGEISMSLRPLIKSLTGSV